MTKRIILSGVPVPPPESETYALLQNTRLLVRFSRSRPRTMSSHMDSETPCQKYSGYVSDKFFSREATSPRIEAGCASPGPNNPRSMQMSRLPSRVHACGCPSVMFQSYGLSHFGNCLVMPTTISVNQRAVTISRQKIVYRQSCCRLYCLIF